MSTVASEGATFRTVLRTCSIAGLVPQYISEDGAVSALSFFAEALYAAVRVATSFSLSQGFTMKSNAPRFIPSTASAMSAHRQEYLQGTSYALVVIDYEYLSAFH